MLRKKGTSMNLNLMESSTQANSEFTTRPFSPFGDSDAGGVPHRAESETIGNPGRAISPAAGMLSSIIN